ncbi:MAG: hypothetical protein M1840_006352 [Geoglossum simile]|nr:MAG: hypothetical protein M1840_006352 [Geoglossum simile]
MATPNPKSLAEISSVVDASMGKFQSLEWRFFYSLCLKIGSLEYSMEFPPDSRHQAVVLTINSSRPRTHFVPKNERPIPPPPGFLPCVLSVLRISDPELIRQSSLDAYFFLRYLSTLLKIFAPLTLVVIPILVPLNAMNGKDSAGGVWGLDRLSWANVGLTHTDWYWAHLTLAIVVVIYVSYTIWDELQQYIRLRQAYLTSHQHRLRASASTVLITSIPNKYLSVENLRGIFDVFPGGVSKIWINRNLSKLTEKIKRRRELASSLEAAETKLIQKALKAYASGKGQPKGSNGISPLWKRYLTEEDREFIRLPVFDSTWMPSLPLVGTKVDTIDHCRKEYVRLTAEIEQEQQQLEEFPLVNSAFIQFNQQITAHMVCQSVNHYMPQYMTPRHVETSPEDVLWENMSIGRWEEVIRTVLTNVAIIALIIVCAIPITFTGLLSQIIYLAAVIPWLDWINRLPHWLLGVVQGVLPSTILASLLAGLSKALRFLIRKQGKHSGMAVELSMQNYYFIFLFVQVFLVVSLSAGFTTVIEAFTSNVSSVPAALAKNLPKANNYFFSYMLLQALLVSASTLTQVGTLINLFFFAPLLDTTAGQKWARQTDLPQIQWGTFFPVYTNLACIGLIYSVISPMILLFNIIAFALFWITHRYNTLYVTRPQSDTYGLFYPKAITQLFAGLYFMEASLAGLFFLIRDSHEEAVCNGQAAVMIVTMISTAIYQYILNETFGPLLKYLPIKLDSDVFHHDQGFVLGDIQETGMATEMPFRHESSGAGRPVIRIPKDILGISEDEIHQSRALSKLISISDRGVSLDINGRVNIDQLQNPYETRWACQGLNCM